ncbi:hypothetical protein [Hydrogenophaga sp.]|uniref:hypothetical protein n=1 Tax=Hydrogenophaga sp. TaxID=1904254 RepID=UPI0025BD82E1|nr:hypothetical protein [Hydrogenophaga sp.]
MLASLRRRVVVAGGALMVALSLAACGQPVVSSPRCGAASPTAAGQRVLVSFRQATVADAPAVIEQLQTLAGACVRLVSSVSPTLHVYVVSGPVDMAVLRARWLTWAAVRDVEADVLIRRQ